MSDRSIVEQPLVFGLDIGTRNVVGTVGYRTEEDEFIVVAQYMTEHQTRAMLDGQIHDIGRVGRTIGKVKEELEAQIGKPLTEVCIAAAGRVLKTVTTHISYDFQEETIVDGEDINTLNLLGIEHAQDILKEMNDTRYKFYCVGYSVVKYYLNDDVISNLEAHKADRIGEDVIVTFLPEDVVDGLYAAVEQAGLVVANMTLEPIAAINVAIPENFRLLNIALVDIGAGTSDISVTRGGSIIAYGMIPLAGDEITELIVQNYLVDFNTAESIKLSSGVMDEIVYKDIMMIEHTVSAQEIWDLAAPVVDRMTEEVAAKIQELNGDKSVSAAFIVGGGGKIHGYTEMLAEKLGLPKERVALRGEEVLQEVTFLQTEIKKDPLLVTPIGICLNYYDQRNNFIMVRFNGERVKLYDNNKLTIVDVALQAGFPNEELFPKRGKALEFMVNGIPRIVRGEAGESAQLYLNGRPANINTPLEPNCEIYVEPSTMGGPAKLRLEQLEEYTTSDVTFIVNNRIVRCPRFLEVNGSLEPPFYEICSGDKIETRSFYTVGQLVEFMDVELDEDREIFVNNRLADLDTLIYENFTIEWTVLSFGAAEASARWQSAEPAADYQMSEEAEPDRRMEAEPAVDRGLSEGVTEDRGSGEPRTGEYEVSAGQSAEEAGGRGPAEPQMVSAGQSAESLEGRESGELWAGGYGAAVGQGAEELGGGGSAEPRTKEHGVSAGQSVESSEGRVSGEPWTGGYGAAGGQSAEELGGGGSAEPRTKEYGVSAGQSAETTEGRVSVEPWTGGYAAAGGQRMEAPEDRVPAESRTKEYGASAGQSAETLEGRGMGEPRRDDRQHAEALRARGMGEQLRTEDVRTAAGQTGDLWRAPGRAEEYGPAQRTYGTGDTPVSGAGADAGAEPDTAGVKNLTGAAAEPSGTGADDGRALTQTGGQQNRPAQPQLRSYSELVQTASRAAEAASERQLRAREEAEPKRQPYGVAEEPADSRLTGPEEAARPTAAEPAGQTADPADGQPAGQTARTTGIPAPFQPMQKPGQLPPFQPMQKPGQLPPFQPMRRPGQPADQAGAMNNGPAETQLTVLINGTNVRLTGKKSYIFVDIFDFYEFDLKASAGRGIITKLNGKNAHFSALLNEGDQIELRWQ